MIVKYIVGMDFLPAVKRSLPGNVVRRYIPMIKTTSGQRALRIANVFLISVILFYQLEIFFADELSHFSAEVEVGIDG